MTTINIDKAIRETPMFVQRRDAAQGNVLNAHHSLSAADIRQIKVEAEDATGVKIIRRGRPDAVTAKHVNLALTVTGSLLPDNKGGGA